jgi:hypothetical protein
MESELVSPVGPVRVVHCGSAIWILVRGTLPGFVTVKVNVAVPPLATVWMEGVLITVINGVLTVTFAVAVAVTSGPLGGVPVAVTVFVKAEVTLLTVQV